MRTTLWGALALAAVVAVTRPWTIRPIGEEPRAAVSPAVYVASVWPAKVMAEARNAVPVAGAARAAGARRAIFVTGTGVVTDVDARSRVGFAHVVFGDRASQVDANVQIGPVLRGTALRDALPFVQFSDFTNQIDFAGVATELNARVLTDVLAAVPAASLRGMRVSLTGAAAIGGAGALEIVPIAIQIQGAAR